MPSERKSGTTWAEDELAVKLSQSREKPNAILLSGFLGRGTEPKRWRLYKAPVLREFVEFDEGDVIHVTKVPVESFPAGGSLVWLNGSAKLVHHGVETCVAAADFLSGQIATGKVGLAQLSARRAQAATWLFLATPAFRLVVDQPHAAGVPESTACAVTNEPFGICDIINNPPPQSTLCPPPY